MDSNTHKQTAAGLDRINALDSIRGFASMAVLLGHSLAVCDWNRCFSQIPFINNAFDGRSAVTMFFVLSGFVLSLRYSQDRTRKVHLGSFYVRRITRIWIPWFVFFLLSLAAWAFRPRVPDVDPPLTAHHLMIWSSSFNAQDLFWQLIFRLHDASKMLLPQDWSLGIELRASLLIPGLIFCARYHSFSAIIIGVAILVIKPEGGYYYASFALGTFTAFMHVALSKRARVAGGGIACIIGGFILYQVRWVHGFTDWLPGFVTEKELWMISATGCMLIILGCLRQDLVRTLLETRICAWLGRISYSLYLVQVAVLVCFGPWLLYLLNRAGINAEHPLLVPAFATIIVAVCLALATLGERHIEVPAIRLGRKLTAVLNRTRAGRVCL